MKRSTDILIVGGGVIGCAIAYFLAEQGREVMVLERSEIGAEASSAAAGLLAPLGPLSGPGPFADLLLASFALFPSLVPTLEAKTGLALGYERTGALRTVRNPRRVAHLQQRMLAWQPLGLQLHWLSGDEARQREPTLAPDICAAIYAPQEAQIRAPQLVQAFAQAARMQGAELHSQQHVMGIEQSGHTVKGVYTAQGNVIACKQLIVTTGAWAAFSGSWLQSSLPVSPLRGQILLLPQPTPPLRHIVFGEAIYLAPKEEGVLVGATKEEVGFDNQVTAQGIFWLHTTASRLLPSLRQQSPLTSWAGLRPKTPDAHPILGPAPHWNNVTLAVGHNSVGILLSAITGRSIAELVITGQVPAMIRSFSLDRFNIR